LIVASKVRSYMRSLGFHASSELAQELSRRAQELLDRAAERCEKNGRRTVRPFDL
jgi:histone H3/H4